MAATEADIIIRNALYSLSIFRRHARQPMPPDAAASYLMHFSARHAQGLVNAAAKAENAFIISMSAELFRDGFYRTYSFFLWLSTLFSPPPRLRPQRHTNDGPLHHRRQDEAMLRATMGYFRTARRYRAVLNTPMSNFSQHKNARHADAHALCRRQLARDQLRAPASISAPHFSPTPPHNASIIFPTVSCFQQSVSASSAAYSRG